MNRRSLITRIPAALLLAILPGRLTRRAEAQEVAIDVSGVKDFAHRWAPYIDYGPGQPLHFLRSPTTEVIRAPSGPFVIRSHPEWDAAMADIEVMYLENMRKGNELNRALASNSCLRFDLADFDEAQMGVK